VEGKTEGLRGDFVELDIGSLKPAFVEILARTTA
jgi:hypothetical protein